MAHNQGNQPGDDPAIFGLKFDSEKPRWELLPSRQIIDIVKLFRPFIEVKVDSFNLKKFHRENIINDVIDNIMLFKPGRNNKFNYNLLSTIAFKIFFLLRGKSYTEEELIRSNSPFRWDLLDMKDLEGIVNVYTAGAKKYADWNWQRVSSERYYDALIRHFSTVRTPDRYDSELGCLHLHQAIWNVISLMWLESRIPDEILSAAKKLKGTPPIRVKPLKEKTAKKKAAKKKVTKKKS